MSERAVDISYEPFSREPEYIEANRGFVERLDLAACRCVLDLACGTGTVSDLVLEAYPRVAITGVDISHGQLLLAREHFAEQPLDGRTRPVFVEASADCLPVPDGTADAVIIANAIHNLRDTGALLDEIRRVLRPKGVLAFNTSFYAGTFVPGTERFYREWLKEALGYVNAKHPGGGARKRGKAPRAFSNRWRTPDEWAAVLGEHGFAIRSIHERPVRMNQRCFETVGAYAGLAEVLMSGFPVELASEALMAAVEPALKSVGSSEIPRLWLEEVAVKHEVGA